MSPVLSVYVGRAKDGEEGEDYGIRPTDIASRGGKTGTSLIAQGEKVATIWTKSEVFSLG